MSGLLKKARAMLRQYTHGDLLRKAADFVALHVICAGWYISGRCKMFAAIKNDTRFHIADNMLSLLLAGYPVKNMSCYYASETQSANGVDKSRRWISPQNMPLLFMMTNNASEHSIFICAK